MNDEEYKLHMTMWAAMKSPLIIGTDVTALDAKSYSILTNPAILAISQDPTGGAIIRKWRYYVSPGDDYGIGEIQMHSGNLDNGDYVVVLLNAAKHEMHMNATAADIFVDQGGSISAEAKSNWDVYDLWANRMPDGVANQVLKSNSTMAVSQAKNYLYNATEMSYADGIAMNHTLLMGKKVSSSSFDEHGLELRLTIIGWHTGSDGHIEGDGACTWCHGIPTETCRLTCYAS